MENQEKKRKRKKETMMNSLWLTPPSHCFLFFFFFSFFKQNKVLSRLMGLLHTHSTAAGKMNNDTGKLLLIAKQTEAKEWQKFVSLFRDRIVFHRTGALPMCSASASEWHHLTYFTLAIQRTKRAAKAAAARIFRS